MPKSDFWDKLKTRLIEVSNAAADFTEEQAVVGKLKFDILNLNRKIDRNKQDIGARVLEIARSDQPYNPLQDGEIVKKIAAIGDLEAQINFKRVEITREVETIRSRRKPTAKPAASAPSPTPKPASSPAPKEAPQRTASPAKKPAEAAAKKPGAGTSPKVYYLGSEA